jgi:curli production assembly/transport CsgH protein
MLLWATSEAIGLHAYDHEAALTNLDYRFRRPASLVTLAAAAMVAGDALINEVHAGVGCEIRAYGTDTGSRLEAVISADGPVTGTYRFTVERSSSASPTVDSGAFEIKKVGPSKIKQSSMDLPAGEAFNASLEVNWPGGSSACSASGS